MNRPAQPTTGELPASVKRTLSQLLDEPGARRPLAPTHNLSYSIGRELMPEDWELAQAMAPAMPKTTTNTISKLRARHHTVARLKAAGLEAAEIAEQTGYSRQRLYMLERDPAFAEIVQFYRGREQERFDVVQERLQHLGLAAADEILERLEEDPSSVSTETLRSIVATMLDRAGHAPVHKQVAVSANLSAEDLKQLKDALNASSTSKTEVHIRTVRGADAVGAAEAATGAEKTAGSEGAGAGVREGAGPVSGTLLPARRDGGAD